MKQILLIEDNTDMARAVSNFFEKEGFTVDHYESFYDAQDHRIDYNYDCYLLDLNLPEKSGYEIAQIIRENNKSTPIIAITARDSIDDKLKGFKYGFNDYVVKPFDLRELMARVNAHIDNANNDGTQTIVSNMFEVNKDQHKALFDGRELKLTVIEFNILYCLVKNANLLVRTDDLIEYAWGSDSDVFNPPVRMHISNLRKKIGDDDYVVIETVPGLGYRLNT